MVEITFVRHGQASTGATDEHGYDNLTDLGRQQASWLAEHMKATGHNFDRVFAGNLNRQRDTAAPIAKALGYTVQEDSRLREFDYFGLANSHLSRTGRARPETPDEFSAFLVELMEHWEAGSMCDHLETFDAFQKRVDGALLDAQRMGGRILYVTSGGVIGMAMRRVLGLDIETYIQMVLQIRNTSLHRCVLQQDILALDVFNALPHLDRPDRAHARTFI